MQTVGPSSVGWSSVVRSREGERTEEEQEKVKGLLGALALPVPCSGREGGGSRRAANGRNLSMREKMVSGGEPDEERER